MKAPTLPRPSRRGVLNRSSYPSRYDAVVAVTNALLDGFSVQCGVWRVQRESNVEGFEFLVTDLSTSRWSRSAFSAAADFVRALVERDGLEVGCMQAIAAARSC